MKGITVAEGIPSIEQWQGDKRRLIVTDDLMSETDDRVTKLFTKARHHRNLSDMYIVQNLFGKNKEQRTISLNSHYLVILKNPRGASQMTHLAQEMYSGKLKYVQEAFKDATSAAHGYLLCDLRRKTPDHLRLLTNIFSIQTSSGVRIKVSMSACVKRNLPLLRLLCGAKPSLIKAVLKGASPDLINALSECSLNILKGHVKLTPAQKKQLCGYK